MMTEFRVMPVREGESYLLRSPRGVYLVDGGGFGCGLPEMLQERGVRKLRAMVCTSAAPLAMGGLMDAIQSGPPAGEIWLPEGLAVLPDLALRFNGDLSGWLDVAATRRVLHSGRRGAVWPTIDSAVNRRMLSVAALFALVMAASRGTWVDVFPEKYGQGPGRYFLRLIGLLLKSDPELGERAPALSDTLFGTLDDVDLAVLCGRLLLARFDSGQEEAGGSACALQAMILTGMTRALAERSEARRRYFRPVNRLTGNLVARHPLRCMNGLECEPLTGLEHTVGPESIFSQAMELGQTGRGLVFQYGDAGGGALFLSDSRLQFLGKGETLRLDRPTVVTAPGQGSCHQEAAYARIESVRPSDNVWVRARLPRSRKVAAAFTRQPNTLCLQNCRTGVLREILLQFADGGWRQAEDACGCA
ncbi:hypothetical protein [Pseudodesulfovibrio sp.]|uniref:hypothetical protein n=1 Tax=Pseudodesulfovibrio sp. TaxID=2035812 RepID=UPI002604772F|nr:hypothetical protein [Pseudodesulfovibrio sp.]MDD3311287.1 hypothetical protein [Pseudodesulfovibrio sp.]